MSDVRKVDKVPIDKVTVLTNHRKTDPGSVEDLAKSIDRVGLIHPITVSEQNGEFELISGRHRLEACKSLTWKTIPAMVFDLRSLEREACTIDENFVRNELTVLERAEHRKRQRELYEALNPAARRPKGGRRKKNDENVSPFTEVASKQSGVSTRTIQQELSIASMPDDVRDEIRLAMIDDRKSDLLLLAVRNPTDQRRAIEEIKLGRAKTVRQALRGLERRKQSLAAKTLEYPAGCFAVQVIDPPWPYRDRSDHPGHRGTVNYPTMSLDDLKVLSVESPDDAACWLWTTNAFLSDAFGLIRAWGFEPKTVLTWVKTGLGVGTWLRGQSEHCILGIKGKPAWNLTKETTILRAPRGKHSEKPDAFYELVERLTPLEPRIDVFSRKERPGWTSWGAEVSVPSRYEGEEEAS